MAGKGKPLPKFGDWDAGDPSTSEGFTQMFDQAREEKRTGVRAETPPKLDSNNKRGKSTVKPKLKKWFCCVKPSQAES